MFAWISFVMFCVLSVFALGMFIGLYRMVGAGIVHFAALKILSNLKKCSNCDSYKICSVCEQFVLNDFYYYLKGLDNWCSERFQVRIENIEEIRQKLVSDLILTFKKMKETVESTFTETFFDGLKEFIKREKFSETISKTTDLIGVQFSLNKESFSKKLVRNLSFPGLISIPLAILSYITTLILSFL